MSLQRPSRPCTHPGCTRLQTHGSRCEQHAAHGWDERRRFTAREKRERYGPRWVAQRRRILARDGFTCVACSSPGPLEVHHLTTSNTPEDEQLCTLCRACHRAVERREVNALERLRLQGFTDERI